MFLATLIYETSFGETTNRIREDGGVGCYKCFEIPRSGRRSSTTGIEAFRYDCVAKSFVAFECPGHLVVGELASVIRFFGAFDDELEALVQLVFDLLSVFQVRLRILLEEL